MSLIKDSISDQQNKVVLCVDDAPETLAELSMTLMSEGYNFVGAHSGEECLKLVLNVAPRLILLDIQMPGLDGFETCRLLRALPQLTKVPIVFVTARKTSTDVKKGRAAGGNDFVIKPFDRQNLMARVRRFVDGVVEPKPTPPKKQTTVTWD